MKNHTALTFLIFICSLMIGYTFSNRFYHSGESFISGLMRLVAHDDDSSIRTLSNGQRSILLITTSSISSSPSKLEAVWMATYLAGDSSIRWLPIFPSGNQSLSVFERQLSEAFALETINGKITLGGDFVKVLEENNYWWSGYIILDEQTMKQSVAQLGRIELGEQTFSAKQITDRLLTDPENPHIAYTAQTAVLQSACGKVSQIVNQPTSPQNLPNFPRNLITDLDIRQLQAEFYSMITNDQQLSCRFPLLEISAIGQ